MRIDYDKDQLAYALANALKERDEARKHLEDVKEYGTDEINAAVDLRQKLAQALVECDEEREKLSARWQSLRDSQDEVLRLTFENRELSQSIEGWENKWKCAIDMAARAEMERDDAFNKLKELKDILR